ncbi:MAG: hypothetical protein ACRCXK_11105 [Wohlfahrtiimonas sp.]
MTMTKEEKELQKKLIRERIEILEEALTNEVLSISHRGKSTQYRSLREIKDAIAYYRKKLSALNGQTMFAFARFSNEPH